MSPQKTTEPPPRETPAPGKNQPWVSRSAVIGDAFEEASLVAEFYPDGGVRNANENLLRLLGYTRDELQPLHHRDLLLEEESCKPTYITFWLDRAAGHFASGVFKHRTKTGDCVWLYAKYLSTFSRGGVVEKVVMIADDATELIGRASG